MQSHSVLALEEHWLVRDNSHCNCTCIYHCHCILLHTLPIITYVNTLHTLRIIHVLIPYIQVYYMCVLLYSLFPSGVGSYLKSKNSDIQVVLADPQVGKDSDIQVVLADPQVGKDSDIQVVLADPQVGKDSDIQVVLAGTGSHWLTSTYVHDHFMCAYTVYVCLPGLWLGGLLHLSFLSVFLKLVCCAHVFSCTMFSLVL